MMRFPALPLLLCCAVLFGPTANAQRTFGTLVIVESEPIPKAASPLSAETAAEWRLVELVHAPLFTESPTGALEPHLASGLKVLDGGRKLVVSLSENARWAVGKDVSAVDVVYTYTLARAGKWNKAWVDLLRPVTGVDRAANGFDIVFELRAPVKDPKRLLVVPIVPSGLHGPLNDPDRQRPLPLSSLGAGPFAPKGPTAPNTFVASAHAIKKPRISEVRILTTGSRRAALEIVRLQGDAVTFDVAPEDLPSLPSELGGRTLEMPVRELLAIAWTKKGGAITEGGVRAALEQGLDRAELFAPGEGAMPSAAPVAPGAPGYPAGLVAPPRDARAAQAALLAAGWSRPPRHPVFLKRQGSAPPVELTVPLLVDADDRGDMRRAAILRQRMAQIGILLEVDPKPRFEYRNRVHSGRFEVALARYDVVPGDGIGPIFHSAGGDNGIGFQSPQVDRLIDAGDLAGAARAVAGARPMIFLGIQRRYAAPGKSVQAAGLVGRGGLLRVDLWQVR